MPPKPKGPAPPPGPPPSHRQEEADWYAAAARNEDDSSEDVEEDIVAEADAEPNEADVEAVDNRRNPTPPPGGKMAPPVHYIAVGGMRDQKKKCVAAVPRFTFL